jgi:hypothetical protein
MNRVVRFQSLFVLALLLALARPQAFGQGALVEDVTTPFGKFGGVPYVKHTGRFVDSAGNYKVPYEIVAPKNARQGNGAVLVELSHFWLRTMGRDYFFGQDFLFGHGFSYAAVGWGDYVSGPWDFTILDPTANDVFAPAGVGGVILGDFAMALHGQPFGMKVDAVYGFGYSHSPGAHMDLLLSDQGAGVFDFTIIGGLDFPNAIPKVPSMDRGRVMILRAECDIVLLQGQVLHTEDALHPFFRIYEFAGMPHVPAMIDKDAWGNPIGYVTPQIDLTPYSRSLFLAGHLWATQGKQPPGSVYHQSAAAGSIDPVYGFSTGIARGELGNALGGVRQPDLEVGRGQFLAANFINPLYDDPEFGAFYDRKDTAEFRARYPNHGSYVLAFEHQVNVLLGQGFLLRADATAWLEGAGHSDAGK